MRYTLTGSARDTVASLRAEIEALKAAARAEAAVAPESVTARETFAGFRKEREINAAKHTAGFWCERHKHSFAFRKTKCPRDGGPLA